VLVSPHAGAVALARLLHPLGDAVRSVAATVLLPVSELEEAALHELFEQTRSILAFAAPPPSPVLGGQLAFNVVQGRDVAAEVVDPLVALLGPGVEISAQTLLGGVFHGVAVSAYVRLDKAPDLAGLRAALAGAPDVELRAAEGLRSAAVGARPGVRLGPIDAAQSERLLVGELRPDPRHDGAYWIWATLDNLTAGGALNALAIASAVV
jgi:aspartate-semialdehyde dehydrogenase